jgi:hypothetical protein
MKISVFETEPTLVSDMTLTEAKELHAALTNIIVRLSTKTMMGLPYSETLKQFHSSLESALMSIPPTQIVNDDYLAELRQALTGDYLESCTEPGCECTGKMPCCEHHSGKDEVNDG